MSQPIARHHPPDDPALTGVLDLIHGSFAYMEGRIDPPSSVRDLTLAMLSQQAQEGEVWSLGCTGGHPLACMVLTPKPKALYLGKIATRRSHRGLGLSRQLIGIAKTRARARGLSQLDLQSRVELTQVHARFAALGFVQTGLTTHAGYARPTSITMTLKLDRP